MSQVNVPKEVIEIAKEEIEIFDDLPEYTERPEREKIEPSEFDKLMQRRLGGRELEANLKSKGVEKKFSDKANDYWRWRFQPENIPLEAREYTHQGNKSLFAEEDGYGPEGVFFYLNPFKETELLNSKISQPEITFYGVNESEDKAYILLYELDEDIILEGGEKGINDSKVLVDNYV